MNSLQGGNSTKTSQSLDETEEDGPTTPTATHRPPPFLSQHSTIDESEEDIIIDVTDEKNMKVASGLVAPLIGLGLAAIHISLAFNAGCAINPARDFSP